MKARIISAGLTTFVLLSFLLTGCVQNKPIENETVTETPAQSWQQASDAMSALPNLTVHMQSKEVIIANDQTFTNESRMTLSFKNRGAENALAAMEQTIRIGTDEISVQALCTNDTEYYTVNGTSFLGASNVDSFCARHAPAPMLDTSLYNAIESRAADGYTLVGFSQPTDGEHWALPSGARLEEACGLAVLNDDGKLCRCRYDIIFTYGAATHRKSVTAVFDTTAEPNIVIPTDTTGYIPLNDPEVPLIPEQAAGLLLQAGSVQSDIRKTISCQAFGISRQEDIQLSVAGAGDGLDVSLNTKVIQSDQSQGSSSTVFVQVERFQNGIYTVATDDNPPEPNDAVDVSTMRNYCRDLLVQSILLPQYITGMETTVTDTTIRYEITASEALAETMCTNACQTLYSKPTLLNDLASAYRTDEMTCYLELDRFTCLPLSAGIRFSGIHTIEGFDYQLTSTIEQTYRYASIGALPLAAPQCLFGE